MTTYVVCRRFQMKSLSRRHSHTGGGSTPLGLAEMEVNVVHTLITIDLVSYTTYTCQIPLSQNTPPLNDMESHLEKQIAKAEGCLDQLSEYEKMRLENMKERQALLEQLDIDQKKKETAEERQKNLIFTLERRG